MTIERIDELVLCHYGIRLKHRNLERQIRKRRVNKEGDFVAEEEPDMINLDCHYIFIKDALADWMRERELTLLDGDEYLLRNIDSNKEEEEARGGDTVFTENDSAYCWYCD